MRDLRQTLARYLRQVKEGERVSVTERRVTMPAGDLTAVEPPRALSPDSPPSRAALDQQREERL